MAEPVFEDEFMDVQSSLVSLLLEALEHVGREADVRIVYLYASIEGGMMSFNAFAQLADRGLRSLEELVTDDDLYAQVCGFAYEDLGRLRQVCAAFDQPCPTELRGRYDVVDGGYTSSYSYEPLVGIDGGQSPSVIFRAWLDDVAAGEDDLAEGVEREDDAAYGGFLVSNNVLAGVPARFAFREPSTQGELNGWTVYSDVDDEAYISDPANFTIVTATTVSRFSPELLDVFDAPYGTDLALLYDEGGYFAGFWDNEGEREVTPEEILAGGARG